MSGPVTSVARVEDVQIFLKDPVYFFATFRTQTVVMHTRVSFKYHCLSLSVMIQTSRTIVREALTGQQVSLPKPTLLCILDGA